MVVRCCWTAILAGMLGTGTALYVHDAMAADGVDYSRQVRPILAQNCFACHGPDEQNREADLRLDVQAGAWTELASGAVAVVPGDPDASELIARIEATDPDLRMPPASSAHGLSDEQRATLRAWVAQGGEYAEHWSFRPLTSPEPPTVVDTAWPRGAIDRFVLARLEMERLQPSSEADRATLLRRLSLDLLGIPPTPEDVERFVGDDRVDAYERLVDRLLASPHFGERWGRHWLDLARYADSDGYLGDNLRPYAWLYRDWVIDAVNRDMPFDKFTVAQLAGDLLPDASVAERTATGFLRNSLHNTEAGVDKEEHRIKEVVDRTSTVGTVWLGLSVGCAECHSHKYDPISHREFYQLFAFFNNADDVDVPAPRPGEMEAFQRRQQTWQQRHAALADSMEAAFRDQPDLLDSIDRGELLAALATEESKRTAQQRAEIERLYERADDALRGLCVDFQKHALARPAPPSTKAMAMAVARRKQDRETYVHLRGDFRSRGEAVTPGTLDVLHPFGPRSDAPDRLDLARWLVDSTNPLTPRVTVNHIWQHLFGQGLVSTVDDFGASGEAPSHPELLDWLASRLLEAGWSRKALVREIVFSATYRQSSDARRELQRHDPLNRLLARQHRHRLEAEVVRDAALAASGLLVRQVGGPSFRPPQPTYVTAISRNADWKVSTGADRFRRGLYILFRRATPYPMLLAFDAPESSATCTRRERTNSPLQALTLLNDPVFFECAQALGSRLVEELPDADPTQRAVYGFRLCLGRSPNAAELQRLVDLYRGQRAHLAADPASAREIVGPYGSGDWVESAAWVIVARVLLNLDEFITRE